MNAKGGLVRDSSVCKAGLRLGSLHPPESRHSERLSGQGWEVLQRLVGPALPDPTPTQPSSPSPLPGSADTPLAMPMPASAPLDTPQGPLLRHLSPALPSASRKGLAGVASGVAWPRPRMWLFLCWVLSGCQERRWHGNQPQKLAKPLS